MSEVERKSPVRTCLFSYSGNMIVYTTDFTMNQPCEIFFADVRDPSQLGENVTRTTVNEGKVTSLLWGPLDDTIITGHDTGKLTQWDLKVKKMDMILESLSDTTMQPQLLD